MTHENKPIVFAFWKDNELKGFKADTFNTISMRYPKIYTYSTKQVEICIDGIKSSTNRAGTTLMKMIAKMPTVVIAGDEEVGDANILVEHVSKTEKQLAEWGEFEVRVHQFIPTNEFYELGEGDEWKLKKIFEEFLETPAIETYKFKVLENPN